MHIYDLRRLYSFIEGVKTCVDIQRKKSGKRKKKSGENLMSKKKGKKKEKK